jgi:hypothetical protein
MKLCYLAFDSLMLPQNAALYGLLPAHQSVFDDFTMDRKHSLRAARS